VAENPGRRAAAYLGVANALALLRLLPMRGRDKEAKS
jgi:hypothetical protein